MDCSVRQPYQGEEELGAFVVDIEPGGVGSEGVGTFLKSVAQAVLLFGAEMWVLTPRMEQALDSFQHRVARRLTGRHTRRQGMGVGITHHWREKFWKQASKGREYTPRGGRTGLLSIL